MRILAGLAAIWFCIGAAHAQSPDPPEVFAQTGHSQGVIALAYSPDGSILASSGGDNAVKLWDVASEREIRTIGPNLAAMSLTFSPDGQILAATTLDQKVRLLDPATGRDIRILTGHVGPVGCAAFSPDGRVLASGGDDRTIRLWDVASGRQLAMLGGFSRLVLSVAFSPDGRYLAANSEDHAIRLWDTASGNELQHRFKGYSAGRIAFSPDGRMIASGSSSHTIKFWDVETGRELGTLSGHADYVAFVAFSPDGRLLASSSYDKTVKIWDLSSGQMMGSLGEDTPSPIWASAMAFSPSSDRLTLGLEDGAIRVWDTSNGREVPGFGGHSTGVTSALFSPDGHLVAFAGFDGSIKIWDAATARQLRVLTGHSGYVTQVAFSPDGSMLASSSADHTAKLWDVASGRELRTLRGHGDGVDTVTFAPDGRSLATGSDDKTIKLWDVASGRLIRTLTGNSGSVNSVAFSPDGRTLASGSGDLGADGVGNANAVKLWDVERGTLTRTILGHAKWVTAVTFSPDGTLLASASDDRTVKLWDWASGREVRTFGGFFDRVSCVAFAPDGHTLAAGSHDGTVKLWDVASGNDVRTLAGHADLVNSIAFSADQKWLITASWTSAARIWNVASGKEQVAFVAFTDGSSLAITPEGYYDASEKAEDNLNVRVGSRVFPIAAYRDKFYRPDLVRLSAAGKSLTQLGFAGLGSVKVAPLVEFVGLPQTTTEPKLTVQVKITDGGGGIGTVRLFHNGTAVVQDNASGSNGGAPGTRSYAVQLADGANALQVEAYNSDNSMHTSSAVALVTATLPPATRANLYAVVVGIQQFKNSDYNLTYPVKDAQLFADTLKKYSAPLFGNVTIKMLTTPAETTRDSLLKTLGDMKTVVGPDDLFVFYVASHGLADDGEYYLITSNVGSASTEHLKSDAVSKEDLTALVANIPATKKLMVIDTCHAEALGSALQAGLLSRGLDEVTALKILSRAVGTTVLAASTSTQEALEGYQGHGLFTYVVAEGLMGKGDVDKNGIVSTLGLAHFVDRQVPDLAQSQFNHAQYPTVEMSGQEFPLTQVR